MRRVGAVTGSRADYGILRPVLRRICQDSHLQLQLLVTGMHLSDDFGRTVSSIEGDGIPIADRIETLVGSDAPEAIGCSMAAGTAGFARAFARARPDILVLVGDRFETHAAAVAALPFNIPVAHLHGGELSEGAIDDALRHSITKLSHLHFVATAEYARRVIQLGEEPWRVVISGAPGLDNLDTMRLPPPEELETRCGMSLTPPPLLVTFHPVTRAAEDTPWHVHELLTALAASQQPVVFTQPNADTGGRAADIAMRAYVAAHPEARLFENLGTEAYFGLMAVSAAMVGNSSSGLVEAPSFRLPVVNVGDRQTGRVKAANVIDVACDHRAILAGIHRATDPGFRRNLQGLTNPYRSGNASSIIVERLSTVTLDRQLTTKHFHDLASRTGPPAEPLPPEVNRSASSV